MPRPKRAKVAPSAPQPRVNRPTTSTFEVDNGASIIVDTGVSEAVFDELCGVSDREEEAARSIRRPKKPNVKGRVAATSRGGRVAGAMSESYEQNLEDREAVSGVAERSSGQRNDWRTTGTPGPAKPSFETASSSPDIEFGRRERTTPAVENSLLAVSNFRRRPRQPSIIGRGTARARSSRMDSNLATDNMLTSRGRTSTTAMGVGSATPANVGSAYKIGTFKRRAREPSILRTAQKERRRTDNNDEDEDDFNPEDESTPLNLSKTRAMTTSSAATSSNSRKRKLSAAQVPRSSPPLHSLEDMDPQEDIPATQPLSDEADEGNNVASSPRSPPIPLNEAGTATPEPMSETMAPPRSSSPIFSSPEPPAQRGRARGRPLRPRTPLPETQDSPISSPPSLTHSPNRPIAPSTRRQATRQLQQPTTFSTAQLQTLLPRRRRRPVGDTFDVASSDDEVVGSDLALDSDDQSPLTTRGVSRLPGRLISRTPAPLKRGPKPRTAAKLKPKPNQSSARRQYGSGGPATSDKENNEELDPDDSLAPIRDDDDNDGSPEHLQELERRVGVELSRAAMKFEEVDKWELEFEEVTASSSSPRGAR